ncbi:MAG: dihydropteroate synthase [Deltaproteobacteria bacterium]|nr:dihydropteroate synthase [Deltaproteobacteria bacterium]
MIVVADNLQVTNRIIEQALKDMDPVPIQDLVKQLEAAGAEAIDVNSGPLPRQGEEKMVFLVETIQQVSRLTLYLDTVNPRALAAGLRACRTAPVINGFSLEPAKLAWILPLAQEFNCDIIGYLLYPGGLVPAGANERLDVAVQLFQAYQEAGLDPEKLIIDPIVPPLMWQDGPAQAREVLTVIRLLPELLGFQVRTVAGLSNLTSGLGPSKKRLHLEEAYLAMLAAADLDMVLLNALHPRTISIARACQSITGSKIFSVVD